MAVTKCNALTVTIYFGFQLANGLTGNTAHIACVGGLYRGLVISIPTGPRPLGVEYVGANNICTQKPLSGVANPVS
jgi:hypothetical protein